jgi:hypothetical protein
MPDVGLTSAAEPVDPKYKVVIKYTIEVEGLAVYSESYDVEKLAERSKKTRKKLGQTGFAASNVLWSVEIFAASLLALPGVC